jgi:hypothetical protein
VIRRVIFKTYQPREIWWLLRANIVVFRQIRCIELTAGVCGYGVLLQLYYGQDRAIGEDRSA